MFQFAHGPAPVTKQNRFMIQPVASLVMAQLIDASIGINPDHMVWHRHDGGQLQGWKCGHNSDDCSGLGIVDIIAKFYPSGSIPIDAGATSP
jgi:hypothetical protein